jgi:hypothetical protein
MPGYKTLTGMGGTGSAADLAEMLRQMGRGPDSVLAHITPEEAEMLMQMGGSGATNPNTGLPEFQPYDYEYDAYVNAPQQPAFQMPEGGFTPVPSAGPSFRESLPEFGVQPRSQQPQMSYRQGFEPVNFAQYAQPAAPQMDIGFGPGRFSPEYGPADVAGMGAEQFQRFEAPQPSPFARLAGQAEQGMEKVKGLAREYPNVANLLSGGAQALPALLSAARARREGGRAAEELRALGRPLREEAENLRQQALGGGLTPQQAREQEAARARLRQQAATRGATTGTQQAMIEGQLQRSRSEMGQVNLQNALRQLQVANAYDEAAIRAGLLADEQVAQRLESIMNKISQGLGSRPGTPQGQEQTTTTPAPITTATAIPVTRTTSSIMPEQPVTQRLGQERR